MVPEALDIEVGMWVGGGFESDLEGEYGFVVWVDVESVQDSSVGVVFGMRRVPIGPCGYCFRGGFAGEEDRLVDVLACVDREPKDVLSSTVVQSSIVGFGFLVWHKDYDCLMYMTWLSAHLSKRWAHMGAVHPSGLFQKHPSQELWDFSWMAS